MSHCNILNIVMMCGTVLFAVICLLLLLKRTKQKKLLLKALQNNQASFESQFENEEKQLKEALTERLSAKMATTIAEIITIEKDSYKKLCTMFIEYHPAAIELLPLTLSKITTAYMNCIRQVTQLVKEEEVVEEVEEVVIEEAPISQHEALIEQLRAEKHLYSEKYKQAQNLLNMIFLKYKEKLELKEEIENLKNMNVKEMADAFNVEYETPGEQSE